MMQPMQQKLFLLQKEHFETIHISNLESILSSLLLAVDEIMLLKIICAVRTDIWTLC